MDVDHVPYSGSSPALNDLMSGQIIWMFETFAPPCSTIGPARSGSWPTPMPSAPPSRQKFPTMIEAGVKGYEA